MPDLVVLLLALAVCVLPGVALLAALDVRQPVQMMLLTGPVSVAVAGLTAIVASLLHIEFGFVSLGVVTLLMASAGLSLTISRRPVLGLLRDGRAWLPRLRSQWMALVGATLAMGGIGFAVATWLSALGGLATYPQEHDTVVHTVLTSYISRTGMAAPWDLLPVDVLTAEPISFYPSGMHLLAGVTADLTGSAVTALNAVTVIMLGVLLPGSVALLAHVASRRLGLSVGPAALAGGFAALVAAGLYRPAFQLAHDGGGLPNAAALGMAPAIIAGFLMLSASSRRAAVAVGIACVGIVWLHPSAVVSVGVSVLAWWVGDWFSKETRPELRKLLPRLALTSVVAATLMIPLITSAAAAASSTGSFPPDIGPAAFGDAVGSTLGVAYGGYLDQGRTTGQIWAAALAALGIGSILMLRRGLGVVVAWATWCTITIAYFLSPATGIETIVTSFLYKAMVRVWSHVSLFVPVLAGLGVVLLMTQIVSVARTSRGRRYFGRPSIGIAILVTLAFIAYGLGPGRTYAERNGSALATRYSEPAFVRVGADDRLAADWLSSRVQPGQRVLNSANDGSTLLYVEYGIPVVNLSPLGSVQAPYTYELLASFNRYAEVASIRDTLRNLDVAWVYVDSSAPVIGAAGSPASWAGDGLFDLAPGFRDIDGLPGLRVEFIAGSVTVYSLDLTASSPQS